MFNLHRWGSRITEPSACTKEMTNLLRHLLGCQGSVAAFFFLLSQRQIFICMGCFPRDSKEGIALESLRSQSKENLELLLFILSTCSSFPTSHWSAKVLRNVKLGRADSQHPAWQPRTYPFGYGLILHSCFCFTLICSGFGWDPRVLLLQNIC
jgi:hypothetical protein